MSWQAKTASGTVNVTAFILKEDGTEEAQATVNVGTGLTAGSLQTTPSVDLEGVRFGIRVDAGMIVGFDSDDTDIFDEQFDFIQAARIPVSMTGLLNAVPKTPLHDRLSKDNRLVNDSTGDQFVMTNIIPKGMTVKQMYEGYSKLLARLYDFDNMGTRVMDYLLTRGMQVKERMYFNKGDMSVMWRIFRDCIVFAPAARRRFTLSVLAQTLAFRPRAMKEAITVVVLHKHLYEYMVDTCRKLKSA